MTHRLENAILTEMNKRISKAKRLEIANICYAEVSSRFAMLNNPKYCGPNSNWSNFVQHCEDISETWMFAHGVRGYKETVHANAKQFSREIAQRLVKLVTE